MYFSLGTSFILTLVAAALWGSWMQAVKHLKGYPITGLIFWLYTFSFIFVWAVTLLLAPYLLPEGIVNASKAYMDTIPKILFGGALMSMGLLCTVTANHRVGLVLSTTISGGVGVILGLVTSMVEEGIPERGLGLMILIALVYIAAAVMSSYASSLRNRDHGLDERTNNISLPVLGMMLSAAILTNGWSIGVSAGTANGIPPILTCAYMATGSFISVLIMSLIYFTHKKMWRQALCIGESKRPVLLGLICSLCHYGGNLISIYSMPALTATVSFLLGRTSSLWTIFWGIYYKEFSNTSAKTKLTLVLAIILFLTGIGLLALTK